MQASSPLAAMQHSFPHLRSWGCNGNAMSSLNDPGLFGSQLDIVAPSFNFKDLSMSKPPMDYFSLKPVRGSSPTASLAADLSSNFHIDQSPRLPTPRRSLFSTNLTSGLGKREPGTIVTPEPQSSSPGPYVGSMEISPLPHKPAFLVENVAEPMQLATPIDETPSGPDCMQDSPMEPAASLQTNQERKRLSLCRPTLARARVHSSTSIPRVECPPFMFGNGIPIKPAPILSAEECFAASPLRDGRPQSAGSPSALPLAPPRYRQLSANLKSMGPPSANHIRKSLNPFQRPRKQFRRSQSMYQHPDEVMKQDAPPPIPTQPLEPVMDVDDSLCLQLPHFVPDNGEMLPRITKETMIDVLDGKFEGKFDNTLIVDCRFEYEYNGGHIDGAMNYNDKESLVQNIFQGSMSARTLLIFHCEYSAHRAPLMAKHLRNEDRRCNAHRYPNLNFPEVYILDGGYSAFYADHKPRCSPQNYITMSDVKHEGACERGMGRVKKQQRAKLGRAHTFAFGQHGLANNDSPTASLQYQQQSRDCSPFFKTMDIAIDSPLGSFRSPSRRMVSF